MNQVLTVKFKAKTADMEITEESVTLRNPEELFEFVAPGGGCDKIPAGVDEITMMFLPPVHPNLKNPLADRAAVLQLGMVIFTGPLSVIVRTMETLLDKAGRGELAESFVSVIGVSPS